MAERVNIEILIETAKSAKGVGELRDALKKLQEAEKEVGKGSKEFDALSDSIQKTKKQMLDEALAASKSAKSIGELRKAMKDLSSLQEEVDATSPDFDILISGINETEGRIGDLNDGFKTFAGSGAERARASTDLLSEGFKNLDTDKLTIGMKGLSKTIDGFTAGVGKIKIGNLKQGFSELSKSGIGEMTKSVIQLGKAILTNPILLLSAVIIALVVALVSFKDKIKPIKAYFDAIGAAVGFVIQKLKDFSDWMGLTDFAGEETANNQIERNKKLEKSLTNKYDTEIKLAQAAGKETYELEIEKQKMILDTTKQQIDALTKIGEINGSLTKEQGEQLEELKASYDSAYTEIQVIQLKRTKETNDKLADEEKKKKEKADKDAEEANKKAEARRKATEDANNNFNKKIEDQKVALIEDDLKRELAKAKLDSDRAFEDISLSAASAEVKSAALIYAELTYQNEKAKIEADFAKKKTDADAELLKEAKERRIESLNELGELDALDYEGQVLKAGENEVQIGQIKMTALMAEKQNKILIAQETGDNLDLINKEYANKEYELKKETESLITAEAKKAEEERHKLTDDRINKAQQLTGAFFAFAQLAAGNDAKKQLELRKKQFKVDKAFSLVRATIDGGRSVQAALTLPPPASFIAAAFSGVLAAGNIAKIAASKFDEGGGAASLSSPPSAPAGGESGGSSTPAPNNFAAGSFYGLGSGAGSEGSGTQRVVVVETDITRTQRNIQKIEVRATQSL